MWYGPATCMTLMWLITFPIVWLYRFVRFLLRLGRNKCYWHECLRPVAKYSIFCKAHGGKTARFKTPPNLITAETHPLRNEKPWREWGEAIKKMASRHTIVANRDWNIVPATPEEKRLYERAKELGKNFRTIPERIRDAMLRGSPEHKVTWDKRGGAGPSLPPAAVRMAKETGLYVPFSRVLESWMATSRAYRSELEEATLFGPNEGKVAWDATGDNVVRFFKDGREIVQLTHEILLTPETSDWSRDTGKIRVVRQWKFSSEDYASHGALIDAIINSEPRSRGCWISAGTISTCSPSQYHSVQRTWELFPDPIWKPGMYVRVKEPGFCHIEPGEIVQLRRFIGWNQFNYGSAWEVSRAELSVGVWSAHRDGSPCTIVEGRIEFATPKKGEVWESSQCHRAIGHGIEWGPTKLERDHPDFAPQVRCGCLWPVNYGKG